MRTIVAAAGSICTTSPAVVDARPQGAGGRSSENVRSWEQVYGLGVDLLTAGLETRLHERGS